MNQIVEIQEPQNVGKVSECQKRAIKKYYDKNREQIVARQVARAKERYANDPEFRANNVLRMREAMRKKKANQNIVL